MNFLDWPRRLRGAAINKIHLLLKPHREGGSWPRAIWQAAKGTYRDVSVFCLFICAPRSGHTLIRSLLDAHPQIVIANEAHILPYIVARIPRLMIFDMLMANSRRFSDRGAQFEGYDYRVNLGSHTSQSPRLKVIGDKRGGRSTKLLFEEPHVLDLVPQIVKADLKFIHVIRNPFDNISTMFTREQGGPGTTFEQTIDNYFTQCQQVKELKTHMPADQIMDVWLETVIESPAESVTRLCDYLGVQTDEQYLEACQKLVFSSPRKTRLDVEWTDKNRLDVEERLAQFKFLSHYMFED